MIFEWRGTPLRKFNHINVCAEVNDFGYTGGQRKWCCVQVCEACTKTVDVVLVVLSILAVGKVHVASNF